MLQHIQAVLEHVLLCMDDNDTILVMLLADQVRQHHKLNVITALCQGRLA